ncbi:MAG: phosphoribosyl-ATP diphosphatase [Phycisphaeraceae bacterium]|nr:phosphoribosyl-ATP diphosphatase [Phycisphaeraceae bacterium]
MIIPSIDLMDGRAVQLAQGRHHVLDAGDPLPFAEKFGRTGEIAVVDLDAAFGRGDNREMMLELLQLAPCRVGGGIRDVATARAWLDAGATRVVIGTAANPEVLGALPRDRVIAALDAYDGEVVIEGWRTGTGVRVGDRMRELSPYVTGFLVTSVEREGMLAGVDVAHAMELRAIAGDRELTIAGGVRSVEEIAELDRLGIDAQIGMALYSGRFTVADALIAMLQSDRPDGLWPTVVVDESGAVLGLAYSNAESLRAAIDEGRGVYWSRSRQSVWRKGESSGNLQHLLRVELDCDRDAIRFLVRQSNGFCHRGTRTCFGEAVWQRTGIDFLMQKLSSAARNGSCDPDSYTARLLGDRRLLNAKICEEAEELTKAVSYAEVVHEAADVLYFTLVKMAASGVLWQDVVKELDRRSLRINRRGGEAKRVEPCRSSQDESAEMIRGSRL